MVDKLDDVNLHVLSETMLPYKSKSKINGLENQVKENEPPETNIYAKQMNYKP